MRVRWNSSPRDCGGRLRETGVVYDDFTSHALEDLLERGLVSKVDDDKPPTTPAKPVPSDGQKE